MRLDTVDIENFGSFVSASASLADRGLILVQGDNVLSTSADSNGAGKSTLLEAIVYGLFGKTVRYDLKSKKPTGDQMVNSRFGTTPGKNCVVRQTWTMDGKTVVVTRYRKHSTHKNAVFVEIDGIDYTRGTTSETDRFIVELIGLDFASFVRSVYFDGKSIVPFPTLPDTEIKSVFEKVLGLDDLAKVSEVVKGKLKIAGQNLDMARADARMIAAASATAVVELQNAVERRVTYEGVRAAEIKVMEGQIADILSAAPLTHADLDAEEDKIGQREASLTAVLAGLSNFDAAFSQWVERKASLEATFREKQVELNAPRAVAPKISKELKEEWDRVCGSLGYIERVLAEAVHVRDNAQSKIGTNCGECGKPITADDLSHVVSHAVDRINDLTAQHKATNDECERVGALIKAAEDEAKAEASRLVDEARKELERLEKEIADVKALSVKFDALRLKKEEALKGLSELQGERSALQVKRHELATRDASVDALKARIEARKNDVNVFDVDVERWTEAQKRSADEAAAVEKRIVDLDLEVQKLKVLDEAYGRTGLKVHILETVTPILNARANDYAARLVDGSVSIEFSTVTKLRDGTFSERFSVNVTNTQGAEGYIGCSSGEQRKIDLAIALAMSDLVASRSSRAINIWVADEIAESLDPTAVDRVVDVLKEKAKDIGTLLVISHTPLNDLIPQVMTVRKTSDGSVIV